MNKLVSKIVMTNTKKGHNKTWTGELYSDGLVVTKWGPIDGWEKSKLFKKAGESFLVEKMMEKEKKGYEVKSVENYETIKTDFYLHNNYDMSEIKENLKDDIDDPVLVDKLAEALYDYFYEVGFDVEFNKEGKIIKVEMRK